jgi:hypothetical protein
VSTDAFDDYIRTLRVQLEEHTNKVRTRTLAMGYAFGRADQRFTDGCEPPEDGHGSAFADFYEQHTNGSWTDLGPQYAAFQDGAV